MGMEQHLLHHPLQLINLEYHDKAKRIVETQAASTVTFALFVKKVNQSSECCASRSFHCMRPPKSKFPSLLISGHSFPSDTLSI